MLRKLEGVVVRKRYKEENISFYTLHKHHCRYTVQSKWVLQSVSSETQTYFPMEHHLSNQLHVHVLYPNTHAHTHTWQAKCGNCTTFPEEVKFGRQGRKKADIA